MAKCYRCGKWGLFLQTTDGYCDTCLSIIQTEEERKKQQMIRPIKITYNPSALLDSVTRESVPRPAMLEGIPMVYSYVISVSYVDRNALYEMTRSNIFDVEMTILDDGDIGLMHNNIYIARLTARKDTAADWINNQLPYICQFTGFKNGSECVVLHLYRDDESRLGHYQTCIAKLIACTSEEKQINIIHLEKGQKLFVEEDDNGKLYVRDVNYHEIGKLPATFNQMHEDGNLRGIYFDHTETVENSNGDENEIPYVRFYFD